MFETLLEEFFYIILCVEVFVKMKGVI